MTILVTGATGLIGKEVVALCLSKGYVVHYLTTSKEKITTSDNYKGFYWNPNNNEIDYLCLKDVSVIINLVGATISKRWTTAYKNQILTSRTQTAKLLVNTIKTHNYNVKHIVSASAIGIYPSSLNTTYSEDFKGSSNTFLGKVVQQWETAVDDFKTQNCKVCKIRIGLVLAKKGGALPQIVKPIKYAVGTAFGSGKQWQSWIHIKDLASLFIFAFENHLEGIYNAVAPKPVSNQTLTKAAAKVLNKPLLLPNIPKFVMKLILGEMHILLFESQNVSSQKIENKGFKFQFSNIKAALTDLLKS